MGKVVSKSQKKAIAAVKNDFKKVVAKKATPKAVVKKADIKKAIEKKKVNDALRDMGLKSKKKAAIKAIDLKKPTATTTKAKEVTVDLKSVKKAPKTVEAKATKVKETKKTGNGSTTLIASIATAFAAAALLF